MNLKLKHYIPLGLIALVLVIGLALSACSPKHQPNAADKAQAKSDLKAFSKCLPASAVGQLELVKSLGSKAGRTALVAKCGIPPNKRQATEAEILSAAEHGHLTTRAGRHTFTTITLPGILERNQA